VEVLAVTAIVGLLAAIAIPAVQAAREAARRASCRNNLKQFGVAIGSFSTTVGHFPSDGFSGGFSLQTGLLPYLEQRPLYDSINFSVGFRSPITPTCNSTAARTRVELFLCPSDRLPPQNGWTSYAGNRGVGVQRYGYNGAFYSPYPSEPSYSDFEDGTAQTAAMSEWVLGPDNDMVRDVRRTVFETSMSLTARDQFDQFAQVCRQIDPRTNSPSIRLKGRDWIRGEFGNTLYNHTLSINEPSCLNGTAVQQGAWTSGSLHPHGANILFADGHSEYLRASMSLAVWRALGSRNGHELAAKDD
jgi:prepilin-type processing-associated H-X9-DG protein